MLSDTKVDQYIHLTVLIAIGFGDVWQEQINTFYYSHPKEWGVLIG